MRRAIQTAIAVLAVTAGVMLVGSGAGDLQPQLQQLLRAWEARRHGVASLSFEQVNQALGGDPAAYGRKLEQQAVTLRAAGIQIVVGSLIELGGLVLIVPTVLRRLTTPVRIPVQSSTVRSG